MDMDVGIKPLKKKSHFCSCFCLNSVCLKGKARKHDLSRDYSYSEKETARAEVKHIVVRLRSPEHTETDLGFDSGLSTPPML